jgi:hypothetical protein
MRGLHVVLIGWIVAIAACATSSITPDAGPPDAVAPDAMPDACAPVDELCNGHDDDCDGKTDEDFPALGGACMDGKGACVVTGTIVCKKDATGTECSKQAGDGGDERCDGIDNDCDGKTDEDFSLGTMCDGPDLDLCTEGVIACDGTGGETCTDATADSVETCNDHDDDCDGKTDEGFDVGTLCDGADADACKEGMIACDTGGAAICTDTTANTVERCNSGDDDCDGKTDEGFTLGAACTVGVGACAKSGMTVCAADGQATACSATEGAPTAELCGDGIDQDCNGSDVSCPINDAPAGAIDVSAGGTFSVDLSAARDDAKASCSGSGGRDVFYKLTLGAPEVVYVDTLGSNFDTTISIRAGACPSNGAESGCGDDACGIRQSQLALSLAAGTYCVIAEQYSSSQTAGALVVNVTRGGRTGFPIAAGSGSQTGNTCNAGMTNQSGTSSCQANTSGNDAGYYFLSCPNTTVSLDATTCGTAFDTVVYLRHGSAASTDVSGGCGDDDGPACAGLQGSFSGAMITAAGLNWLIVDGYSFGSATCGAYTLGYTFH